MKTVALTLFALVWSSPPVVGQEWEVSGSKEPAGDGTMDWTAKKEAVLLSDSTASSGMYLEIRCGLDGQAWLGLSYAKPYLLGLEPLEDPLVRVKDDNGFTSGIEPAYRSGNFRAYLHTGEKGAPLHRPHLVEKMVGDSQLVIAIVVAGDERTPEKLEYEVDLAGFPEQWRDCALIQLDDYRP